MLRAGHGRRNVLQRWNTPLLAERLNQLNLNPGAFPDVANDVLPIVTGCESTNSPRRVVRFLWRTLSILQFVFRVWRCVPQAASRQPLRVRGRQRKACAGKALIRESVSH
jgi:hypothetical protein